jgi:hypothetical protein
MGAKHAPAEPIDKNRLRLKIKNEHTDKHRQLERLKRENYFYRGGVIYYLKGQV